MIPVVALPPPPPLATAFAPLPTPRATAEPLPGLPPRTEDLRDVRRGNVDLKLKIALDGVGASPLSLVGAFGGWNEILLGADVGVYAVEDVTVAVGAEAYWARPWLFGLFSALLEDLIPEPARLDWTAGEAGLLARGTVHYNALETFEPYALVLLGPNRYGFRADLVGDDGAPLSARFAATGLRFGAGGGFSTGWGDGWIAGGELRYLVSPRFRSAARIAVRDATGVQVDTLETVRYQRGPRGFSWVFFVGRRL